MVDSVKITVKSGKGGDGSASFRREKYVPKGGPDGGDGGDGGSVVFVADPHHNTLSHFRGAAVFTAENGGNGLSDKKFGKKGTNLEVAVPLGTIVWETMEDGERRRLGEILTLENKLLVARGGKGGRGNVHFKSSRNTTPLEFELGGEAQERILDLELKLLADIGLVGFPNAGKSTLLSVLTSATPKIANYPFTTLDPHLGVMSVQDGDDQASYVLADIPGLIEEASQGKGLGHQFLRHIERCRVLVFVLYVEEHLLESAQEDPAPAVEAVLRQAKVLREELRQYDPSLLERPSLIALNKIDLLDEKTVHTITAALEENAPGQVWAISAASGDGLVELGRAIHRRITSLPPSPPDEETLPVYTARPEAGQPRLARREHP